MLQKNKSLLRNYIELYEKTDFGFNFGPWDVPKLENMHFHSHAISRWSTSWGQQSNQKAIFL